MAKATMDTNQKMDIWTLCTIVSGLEKFMTQISPKLLLTYYSCWYKVILAAQICDRNTVITA